MRKKPYVKIEIMRGVYRGMLALCIDEMRIGPDAGPWQVIETVYADAEELIAAAERAKAASTESEVRHV